VQFAGRAQPREHRVGIGEECRVGGVEHFLHATKKAESRRLPRP
jgi:hypothetical protein